MDQARIRPAQVGASTAAAVGGAFLASRLGVYGTIIGVGVITLMSTVGSEMLLRSLERTKQAARTATPRLRMADQFVSTAAIPTSAPDQATTTEQPVIAASVSPADTTEQAATGVDDSETPTTEQSVTATLPATRTAPDDDQPAPPRRWPIIAGASLASFGLALAVIVGIEASTGQSLDGEGRPTVVNVLRGEQQRADDEPQVPATPTDESTPTQEDDPASPDDPDGTSPRPDPTTPVESPSPEDAEPSPSDEDETPPPEDVETPPAEDETEPTDEDTPPADEEQTAPDDGPRPAP